MSFGTDQGEVLIPTVVNGRVVSDQEAIAEYRRSGRHFGIFRTPLEATAYAESLHRDQERQYAPRGNDRVFNELIQQESGGRAGAVGPQTRYGRALGMTQMLPDTARGVARSLGLPYREDLLRGTSAEAAEYQRRLGRAYFEEGLRQTGNVRDALHYYHGGPNRRLWGPKTRRYANEILGRVNG